MSAPLPLKTPARTAVLHDDAQALSSATPHVGATGHGWASMNIDGIGEISGDVVGFDKVFLVVAVSLPVDVVRGRSVVFALGIDGRVVQGVAGTTAGVSKHPDGRLCIAIRLHGDGHDATTDSPSRRAKARVPFDAKVDAMVVASRKTTDKNYRFHAIDLSSRGIGVRGAREIPTKSSVLLRFAVPPHRGATMQIRALVSHFQRVNETEFHVGFEFDRVTAAQLAQLQNAIVHLSHPGVASRRPS